MPSKKIKTPMVMDRYFHIYNKGNNKERIFREDEDYQLFIKLYCEIVQPHVSTYAYCLLPNHFHFLIKFSNQNSNSNHPLPSHVLRKFFQAYAIRYNQKLNRKGSLFTKYYRRIEVTTDEYLRQVVFYIHRNPVRHGIEAEFQHYSHSSFKSFSNYENTWLAKSETLAWFNNDLIEFIEFHHLFEEKPDMRDFIIDEI